MSPRKAENFVLKDQFNNDFELFKNLDKNVLLIFYPRDNSPVCSIQLKNYQNNTARFEAAGIRLVGINKGSVGSHKSFCGGKNIEFPVLSDLNAEVSRKFKALNIFSVNKRKLVLINKSGEIVYERSTLSFFYLDTDAILEELHSGNII